MSKELESYIRAGYPAIVLTTAEEDRALAICNSIARSMNKKMNYWSVTKGIQGIVKKYDSMSDAELGTEIACEQNNKIVDYSPIKVLEHALKFSNTGMVYVLLDFHPFIKTPNVWRRAKDLFKIAKQTGITYVFVSSKFDVPEELKREVIVTSLPLPTREELLDVLKKLAHASNVPVPENSGECVEAALGLTLNEAENAFATSIAKYGCFDVMEINHVKEKTICSGGLLEYKSSKETLESIGGLKNFTEWAKKRFFAYSPEAREYGIPAPKGALLVGIPGGGKSLSAKALANLWQKPLLRLDIGKLFNSLVGATETNTREALKLAEAMAPCILWIDEIEKGLAGLQSSGQSDSGVTSRACGTLLTWLQENEAPVFVIATANNVSQLPPEFLRKGRFDEIFFVDIPSLEERMEIFAIQLKKYKRNPDDFDLAILAESSEQFMGAEIEQAIINALYNTWSSKEQVLTTDAILKAIKDISPMATAGSMSVQISALRKWATDAHIQLANGTSDSGVCVRRGRVVLPELSQGDEA